MATHPRRPTVQPASRRLQSAHRRAPRGASRFTRRPSADPAIKPCANQRAPLERGPGLPGPQQRLLEEIVGIIERSERGRCIIYDRRGFSRSERPEPFETVDLSDHVDDAAALLDALSATPAVVIGSSTGGEIRNNENAAVAASRSSNVIL